MTNFSRIQSDTDPITGAITLEAFSTPIYPASPPILGPMAQILSSSYPSSSSLNSALVGLPGFSLIADKFNSAPWDAINEMLQALAALQVSPPPQGAIAPPPAPESYNEMLLPFEGAP